VKNGEYYIEQFIEHYTQMGFRHIFFLDNGSTDQTLSIARKYANVSVCESTLPIDAHQGLFKKYLAQKSAAGGWCLDADIDEFFDYPFSDVIDLRGFLEYLNKKQYTAVMTQLLDKFSDKPVSHLTKTREEDLKAVYQYYDISEVRKATYHGSGSLSEFGRENEVSNANTALCFGGIRKTLYGNDCLLTKHSLFSLRGGLDLFPHVHFVNNARLADVSGVMHHYKLTSNALENAMQNEEKFVGIRKGYSDFINFLLNKPDYLIKQHTAVKFQNVNELVDSGLLFVSDGYRDHERNRLAGSDSYRMTNKER
jgi:glycosyltransferase involved in cell wall biosynthesis